MAEITVIGSMNIDTVVNSPRFPVPGETLTGTKIRTYAGGKGANQCVAAARLGGSVQMIGCLGKDSGGETFKNIFIKDNINFDNMVYTDEPTGAAIIQINDSGENQITVIPSANHEYKKEHLIKAESAIKNSNIVLMQLELSKEISFEIAKMTKRLRLPLVLNPAPAYLLPDEFLACVDYITPNETELSILTGVPTDTDENLFKAARLLLNKGVKNVVATIGKRGALIVNKDMCEIVPAFLVKAVDTVAAGDSFNGALCYGLNKGMDLKAAVIVANAVGALTVTKAGAIPSLPYYKEVKAFLEERQDKK